MSDVTKRALESTLKNLLQQKPLDKITIAELTAECGISRMTFYYHFHDIHELVTWICDEAAAKAIAGNALHNTWEAGLLQIFRTVQADASFFTAVYFSVSRERIDQYLYEVTYDLLHQVVETKSAGIDTSAADCDFVTNFYKYSFVGVLTDWVRTGMQQDPSDIVDRISALMAGNIRRALTSAAHSRGTEQTSSTRK